MGRIPLAKGLKTAPNPGTEQNSLRLRLSPVPISAQNSRVRSPPVAAAGPTLLARNYEAMLIDTAGAGEASSSSPEHHAQ